MFRVMLIATRRNPFQQDTTRFKGDAADTVGETLMGGNNDVETGTKAIMQMTGGDSLPQITQGGMVMMTLHQINGDGAGPYTCMMNADGTAQTWTQMYASLFIRTLLRLYSAVFPFSPMNWLLTY